MNAGRGRLDRERTHTIFGLGSLALTVKLGTSHARTGRSRHSRALLYCCAVRFSKSIRISFEIHSRYSRYGRVLGRYRRAPGIRRVDALSTHFEIMMTICRIWDCRVNFPKKKRDIRELFRTLGASTRVQCHVPVNSLE